MLGRKRKPKHNVVLHKNLTEGSKSIRTRPVRKEKLRNNNHTFTVGIGSVNRKTGRK